MHTGHWTYYKTKIDSLNVCCIVCVVLFTLIKFRNQTSWMGKFILLYQHKMTVNVKVIFTYKMYTLKFKVCTHCVHHYRSILVCLCVLTLFDDDDEKHSVKHPDSNGRGTSGTFSSECVKRFDIPLLCMEHNTTHNNKYILDKKQPNKTKTKTNKKIQNSFNF